MMEKSVICAVCMPQVVCINNLRVSLFWRDERGVQVFFKKSFIPELIGMTFRRRSA